MLVDLLLVSLLLLWRHLAEVNWHAVSVDHLHLLLHLELLHLLHGHLLHLIWIHVHLVGVHHHLLSVVRIHLHLVCRHLLLRLLLKLATIRLLSLLLTFCWLLGFLLLSWLSVHFSNNNLFKIFNYTNKLQIAIFIIFFIL